MLNVLKSILITLVVSTIFGFIIEPFWKTFIIVTLLQFIVFYFFNTLYQGYVLKKAMQLNITLEKEKQKNSIMLACPSCNYRQFVEMNLLESVIYKCDQCNTEIKAEPNVKNYITTNPIYFKDGTEPVRENS
jgi:DNA-directed RNA polymerase subunit RPC12/RpoP|tara:strand:- start:934 stop:1329 length:396 start_codon:yes stop_codon:yes gene_type:complete